MENVPRVLPEGTAAEIDAALWPLPAVFGWLMRQGSIPALEMARVFNCGIGMVIITSPDKILNLEHILRERGETPRRIGRIVAAPERGTILLNGESQWPG
jgi:phosphoribosylformylglycinamidine cyclo-ligase